MKSLVRVGLRPSRNARISFGVQLALVFFWLIYALFLLFTESPTNDRHFVHYIFLAFAVGYLIYILAQNTPVFGTQSYFEITPAYIVLKRGHFRPKNHLFLRRSSPHAPGATRPAAYYKKWRKAFNRFKNYQPP